MKNSLSKNFIREIKDSINRFMSIVIIAALGVAFFAGIRATSPDMVLTADKYFDSSNLMDIQVLSTLGIKDEDLEAIKEVDKVKEVEGSYSVDLFGAVEDSQYLLKAQSLPNNINKIDLVDGRLPKTLNECVVDSQLISMYDINVGDQITFTADSKDDLSRYLGESTYTIVGSVNTSYYLSNERGSSRIGDGSLDGFVMLPPDNFTMEVFTQAYITVKGALESTSYTDTYNDQIDIALDQIESVMKKPIYYTLDRNSLAGYVGFQQDSDRIDAIGQVFPSIFFLVAALVILTTMTRMVESDRTQIGTLKALGYTRLQISKKYILYALAATVTGSLIGMVIGQKILPTVIIDAYSMMYKNMPPPLTPLNLGYSIASTSIAIFTGLAATIFACYKELLATPASLMRPLSPKNGKRVFLEYIPFIWKRLNFTKKVTIRNLLRYKKRFFMTIFGIGSCTALLLIGFGLQDSIFSIIPNQYDKIYNYDATITMDDSATTQERDAIHSYIKSNPSIENSMEARMLNIDVTVKNNTESAYIFTAKDSLELPDFISLHNRTSEESYILKDNGVIITEKLASLLNVSEGDTIELENDDMVASVKIQHIAENYLNHYIYMSKNMYERLFQKNLVSNTTLFLLNKTWTSDQEEAFSQDFLSLEGILAVTMSDTSRSQINDMLDGMDVVIIVLILSAGALAFVVLFNLNNINITERKRELATIKVLGFYDGEVAGYVYRENILLTLIGSFFGMIMGIFLHRFVIITAELDMIMFGRVIYFKSYLYSFLLTLAFSFFVNLILYFKLKSINMIESLKSVE